MGEQSGNFERKEIRIVPDARGARLQIVASEKDVHPEGSFLAEIARRHPKEWSKNSSDPALMSDWVRGMASTQTWNAGSMAPSDPHAWISQNYEALGIDPGVANLAAVASSGGARALVFSAMQIERKLAGFDAKIDLFISKNTPERLRGLDAKRSPGGSLPMNERIERKTLIKHLHASPKLKSLRKSRADYSKEMAHKLARKIAAHAKKQGTAIVFLSRNKGLKTEAGLGRIQERRSHRVPHDLTAQLLLYKLWEMGRWGYIFSKRRRASQASRASWTATPCRPIRREPPKRGWKPPRRRPSEQPKRDKLSMLRSLRSQPRKRRQFKQRQAILESFQEHGERPGTRGIGSPGRGHQTPPQSSKTGTGE